MDKTLYNLHLCGATGQVRTEMLDGREYLVVPVVALMEGVIHPVNAATPEFVPFATLERAAASWNDKPLMMGHPTKNGTQCSASGPELMASHGLGVIKNSRVDVKTKRLLQEAWVEKSRAKALNPELLSTLEAGKSVEVSVGAFVATDNVAGSHNGKPYKATWLETVGDHLALLFGGRGACSLAMGCGTHRAAMHIVTASGFESRTFEEHVSDLPGTLVFTALLGDSLDERISEVSKAVEKKYSSGNMSSVAPPSGSYAYPRAVFDTYVIVSKDGELFSVDYTTDAEGEVTLGDTMTKVEQVYVAAKMATCETCNGLGQVKAGDHQNDCPACNGEGKLKAAAGARHSSSDMKMVQGVHDHAVALGADCDPKNYKMLEVKLDGKTLAGISPTAVDGSFVLNLDSKALSAAITPEPGAAITPQFKAACRCEGDSTMTKEKKAELIAALTTDKYSGFAEGDVAFLESAPDARLEQFKTAAEANKTAAELAAKNENDLRAAQAKITVIEGKLKVAEQAPTEEEWLAKAPGGIKTLLESQKAQEVEAREALIKELKAAGADTEEDLKAMPTSQLQTLAKYAKLRTPDFSGRGIPAPRAAGAGDEDYTPPDSYGPALKALREGSKAVN